MRTYYDINLSDRTVEKRDLEGEEIVRAGRYFIAKTLLELGAATADPLSPANPLIFSAGPFAGTSFSNANRTSVGCKSPLTGGIKEANGGGTFSYGLGQLRIAGFTLHGAASDWVVIHFRKDGSIGFDDATPYLGKGNFQAAELLHGRYGKKVTLALCGPVGEYQGLIAGIAFSDKDSRPSRLAAENAALIAQVPAPRNGQSGRRRLTSGRARPTWHEDRRRRRHDDCSAGRHADRTDEHRPGGSRPLLRTCPRMVGPEGLLGHAPPAEPGAAGVHPRAGAGPVRP